MARGVQVLTAAAVMWCVGGAIFAADVTAPTDLGEFKSRIQPFFSTHCVDCHSQEEPEAGFRLDNLDGQVTNGQDVERWEKALEMLDIGDMPPPSSDPQPTKTQRRQITGWILTELRKIGRGPDDARLSRPAFGNRVDHTELFSGEHTGPAWSAPRMWRKSPHIHAKSENALRLGAGNSPFNPLGGHGFQDYDTLLANESTIKTLRINAKNYCAELIDGALVNPRGADGKPDKTRQVRQGQSRYREFNDLVHSEGTPSKGAPSAAVSRSFELFLQRKPANDELDRYGQFLAESIQIAGPRQGLESLITAILFSPEYIYRQELGLGKQLADGRRMLASREIAYALAYALTDAPPDGDLMKAADTGRLATKEDVAREVRRMLSASTRDYWGYPIDHTFERHVEACPNPRVLRFFREFFGYDQVLGVFKDKSRNPHHKAQFLFKDADLFVLSILEEDRQVLRQLLTSDRYMVHYVTPKQAEQQLERFRKNPEKSQEALARLAKGQTPVLGGYRGGEYYTVYGFEKETWDYPVEQPFAVEHRAGMLTHPAWLAAHSGNFDTDPVRRGKWIREHLLADTIPEIPIGVDAALEEDPHKTLRERLAKTTGEKCWRCHKKMNPLGLPFELFDDFGRYRTEFYFNQQQEIAGTYYEREAEQKLLAQRKQPAIEYSTRPIDARGELTGAGDAKLEGEVRDAFELIERLASSERVRQSFIRHAFRYWMGRNETLRDSPTIIAADRAYLDSGGSFKELLVSLLTSDSFLLRKDEP